jgi:hypothetical protein
LVRQGLVMELGGPNSHGAVVALDGAAGTVRV